MTEKNTTNRGMTPEKAVEVFRGKHESRLKAMRVRKGLSQQGLAEAAGIKKRLVQTYEQGERDINHGQIDTLCDIAKALDCTIPDILEDDELIEKFNAYK